MSRNPYHTAGSDQAPGVGDRSKAARLGAVLLALLVILYLVSSGVKDDADIQAEFRSPAGEISQPAGTIR